MRMFHCLNVYFIFSAKHIYTRAHTHATHIEPCKAFERALFLCIIYIILSQCCLNALHSLSLPARSLPFARHFSSFSIYFDSLCILSDNVRLTCTPIHIFPFRSHHALRGAYVWRKHTFIYPKANKLLHFHEFDEDRRFKWCGILQCKHMVKLWFRFGWLIESIALLMNYLQFALPRKSLALSLIWQHCI